MSDQTTERPGKPRRKKRPKRTMSTTKATRVTSMASVEASVIMMVAPREVEQTAKQPKMVARAARPAPMG